MGICEFMDEMVICGNAVKVCIHSSLVSLAQWEGRLRGLPHASAHDSATVNAVGILIV